MPSKPVRRYYWCANVFLSYINEIPDRLPDIDALLAEARRGEIQIMTSVISVTEVAFALREQSAKALDLDVLARIENLWALGSPVQLVDFHLLIAEKARDLIRGGLGDGWVAKPIDAMHMATAWHEQVDMMHTYDDKLGRYAPIIGCPITVPLASQPQLGIP